MSELINPPSKTELVYDLLRRKILDGELRPGERLKMDALARDLGISKIPIREAINRLETQGFVTSRQHAGPAVAEVDGSQLRGAYLARAEVEPLVARLAAENATNEDIAELRDLQRRMRRALTSNRKQLGDLNSAFHARVGAMCGYAILAEVAETLLLAVRRYRVTDPLSKDSWSDVVEEHDAIIAALDARNPEAAWEAARAHATSQGQHDRAV